MKYTGIVLTRSKLSSSSVKRWPIITASIAGVLIGFLCVFYISIAFALTTSLTGKAFAIVLVLCPDSVFIFLFGFSIWWLVPLLNALLYGGVAFGIAKWRVARKLVQDAPR